MKKSSTCFDKQLFLLSSVKNKWKIFSNFCGLFKKSLTLNLHTVCKYLINVCGAREKSLENIFAHFYHILYWAALCDTYLHQWWLDYSLWNSSDFSWSSWSIFWPTVYYKNSLFFVQMVDFRFEIGQWIRIIIHFNRFSGTLSFKP